MEGQLLAVIRQCADAAYQEDFDVDAARKVMASSPAPRLRASGWLELYRRGEDGQKRWCRRWFQLNVQQALLRYGDKQDRMDHSFQVSEVTLTDENKFRFEVTASANKLTLALRASTAVEAQEWVASIELALMSSRHSVTRESLAKSAGSRGSSRGRRPAHPLLRHPLQSLLDTVDAGLLARLASQVSTLLAPLAELSDPVVTYLARRVSYQGAEYSQMTAQDVIKNKLGVEIAQLHVFPLGSLQDLLLAGRVSDVVPAHAVTSSGKLIDVYTGEWMQAGAWGDRAWSYPLAVAGPVAQRVLSIVSRKVKGNLSLFPIKRRRAVPGAWRVGRLLRDVTLWGTACAILDVRTVSPDVVVAVGDAEARFVAVPSGDVLHRIQLPGDSATITHVQPVSPTHVLACTLDGAAHVLDAKAGALAATLPALVASRGSADAAVMAMCSARLRGGRAVAAKDTDAEPVVLVGYSDGVMRAWHLTSAGPVRETAVPDAEAGGSVDDVIVVPSGATVVLSGKRLLAWPYDAHAGQPVELGVRQRTFPGRLVAIDNDTGLVALPDMRLWIVIDTSSLTVVTRATGIGSSVAILPVS